MAKREPVPAVVEPDTRDPATESQGDKIQVTGTVIDLYGAPTDPANRIFAVVGFPLEGGGTIGIPTGIEARIGEQLTLDAEVVEASRYVTKVTIALPDGKPQVVELSRFRTETAKQAGATGGAADPVTP